ncbi:MAG: hypothetical protein IKS26_05005, partial [Paludibacteraceae bacterium]|nr:hypothetical protein [Paludibacteraceae bacterium]
HQQQQYHVFSHSSLNFSAKVLLFFELTKFFQKKVKKKVELLMKKQGVLSKIGGGGIDNQ